MTDEVHDTSRVDNFLAARNRAMVLHSVWRPMLAGGAGAAIIIAAVAIAQPRFTTREVIVDHVVPHDVTVDHVIPHDVEIAIPRIVTAPPPSPLARTPDEKRFTTDPSGWGSAVVKGRILRQNGLGFTMLTETEGEKSFFPAKIGPDGKSEFNSSMKDNVSSVIGLLAFCRQMPNQIYQCTALGRDGHENTIPEVPVGEPL